VWRIIVYCAPPHTTIVITVDTVTLCVVWVAQAVVFSSRLLSSLLSPTVSPVATGEGNKREGIVSQEGG